MLMVAEGKHTGKITPSVREKYLYFPLNSFSVLTRDFCEARADSAISLTLQWLCQSFLPDMPAPEFSPSLLPTAD